MIDKLVGADPDEETRNAFDFQLNATPNFPDVYAWGFEEDSLVTQYTVPLIEHLNSLGVNTVLRIYHGGAHGLGLAIGYEAEGWMDEAVAFWMESR